MTGLALATTAYSGVLGAKLAAAGKVPADGGTTPDAGTPEDVARVQQQQRVLQWVIPTLTGAIVVLGAQQGEQQRPSQQAAGVRKKIRDRAQSFGSS